MKKLLVLTGRYYPKASPNSICVKQVIDALREKGWETTVICYDDGLKEEGEERVYRVSRGAVQSAIYKKEEGKTRSARVRLKLLGLLRNIKQLPFILSWPWTDPAVTKRTLRLAERLYAKERFDAVVAVHMPISNVIVGHKLKERHPELGLYPYFLDALIGGYLPRVMSRAAYERKALKWEKKLLANADKAVFMEANREHHERVFEGDPLKERFVYLDIPLFTARERADKTRPGTDIVYVGTLAPGMRSPEFFLKVFGKAAGPDWRLTFVGDAGCAAVNSAAARDERIRCVGRISHEEALDYERGADILLNLGNRNPNLTPSKVFEYAGFGAKIVSTYSSDDDRSLAALAKYPAALMLDERETDITAAAERLRAFAEAEAEKIPIGELESRFYANTPDAFAKLLTEDEA